MYDSNSQTQSNISVSHASYASDQDPAKAIAHRDSSSVSIGISEELAYIKREVASLKDQVWNRANNEFLPSEDCSILNSFTDPQPDQSYIDDRLGRNKEDKVNDSSAFLTNQLPNAVQNAGLGIKSIDSSPYSSELEKSSLCEVTLPNFGCKGEANASVDKELLYNGAIVEVNLSAEAYVVASANNGIKNQGLKENQLKRRKVAPEHNPFIVTRSDIDNTSNGLVTINLRPPLFGSEVKPNLLVGQNSSNVKYKEMVSSMEYQDERKKVIFTDLENQQEVPFSQKKQELANMNNRILEEEEVHEDTSENSAVNPLLKKTLSVIFSTNESIESTPPQSLLRKSLQEIHDEGPMKLVQLETKDSRYTCEPVRTEGNEDRTVEDSYASCRSEEKKSGKGNLVSETSATVMVTEGISTLGSEETFTGLLYVTKLQAKVNKGLEEKLNRLGDLYNKQIEKYEKTIKTLNEKNEKYMKGNELLVKTLKTCEKEIDSLALNNQTLHKNLLMFEEDMGKKKLKEKQLIEANSAKQRENEKLVEDLKKKETEAEDFRKKFAATVVKLETAKVYAKSCEDSISAIDQTLRRIFADKGGPKLSLIVINKVLESIFVETSKFVQKSEKSTTLPGMTCETEAKSPPRRCFTSIGTDDTFSTFDYREHTSQSHSAKKVRSKTPDTHSAAMSPRKGSRNIKTLPESPSDPAGDNRILMQRLIAASGLQQRSVSSNIRRSFDHRRASDRDESNVLRPSQTNTIQRRESASTSPCGKVSENKKSKQMVKMTPELDKIKENLRRKVLRHVSPAPSKR